MDFYQYQIVNTGISINIKSYHCQSRIQSKYICVEWYKHFVGALFYHGNHKNGHLKWKDWNKIIDGDLKSK